MLCSFDYALDDSESEQEYKCDESNEEELKDDEPTQTRTKHVNPMQFIPNKYYALIESPYMLMV